MFLKEWNEFSRDRYLNCYLCVIALERFCSSIQFNTYTNIWYRIDVFPRILILRRCWGNANDVWPQYLFIHKFLAIFDTINKTYSEWLDLDDLFSTNEKSGCWQNGAREKIIVNISYIIVIKIKMKIKKIKKKTIIKHRHNFLRTKKPSLGQNSSQPDFWRWRSKQKLTSFNN